MNQSPYRIESRDKVKLNLQQHNFDIGRETDAVQPITSAQLDYLEPGTIIVQTTNENRDRLARSNFALGTDPKKYVSSH